jgi:hypothetical protein
MYFGVGAVIPALALGCLALAQPLANRNLSGNEVIVAAQGGPGGPSIFVPTSQLRGGSNPTTTATTSGTLSTITNTTGLLISTAAAGGAMIVNLPANPYDGQAFVWVNGAAGAFTTGNTVATTDGSTIVGSNATGALAAGASVQYVYVLATNSWYKAR